VVLRGQIAIYHGDAREILRQLADTSVDFVLTPPHGQNNNGDLIHVWAAR